MFDTTTTDGYESTCSFSSNDTIDADYIRRYLDAGCECPIIEGIHFANGTIVHCNAFPVQHEFYVQVVYCLLYATLVLSSVAGNLIVAWIVLRHQCMRTVINMYLLNLAISDLTITLLNTGFSFVYNFYYNWFFPTWYCPLNNLLAVTPICASTGTMMVMSIDRYFAIVYPLRRRPSRGATVSIIVLIWVLAILVGLPAFYASKVETHMFVDHATQRIFEDRVCLADNFPDGSTGEGRLFCVYNHLLTISQYVIPLLVLTFTYGRIAFVLRQKNNIGDTRHCESVRAKRKVSLCRLSLAIHQHSKASNMLALVVTTFIIAWLPYNVYFLFIFAKLQGLVEIKTALYVYMNIYFLGMSSTVFNPIIYYFMNDRFRLGFRYAFRWLPFIQVRRAEYEAVFKAGARNSQLTSRFSVANTAYSQQPKHSGESSPVQL